MNGRWDLMPESCRVAFTRRRCVRRWIASYVMTFVVLVVLVMGLRWGNSSKQAEHDALESQVSLHWMRNEEARGMLEAIREMESSIARYNRLAWPVRVSDAIGAIETLIPASTTLTSLTLVPRDDSSRSGRGKRRRQKEEPEGEPERMLVIEIEGVAIDDHDVARLVRSLEEHRLFSSVNLDYARSREVSGIEARAFRLTSEIDLNVRYSFMGLEEVGDWGVESGGVMP